MNGTPDLTNKFILAAGGTYNPGDTGGKNTYLSGEVKTEDTSLTITAAGTTALNLTTQSINSAATGTAVNVVTAATATTTVTATVPDHKHDLQEFSNMPAYYALAYIMRIV